MVEPAGAGVPDCARGLGIGVFFGGEIVGGVGEAEEGGKDFVKPHAVAEAGGDEEGGFRGLWGGGLRIVAA